MSNPEKASIDEVFLNLSTPVRDMIFERWPSLRDIPPTGPNTPLPEPPQIKWSEEHGHILSVSGLEEESGIGKGQDSPATWHDVALSIGGEIVNRIRLSILKDVRYTTSGGIARNKSLAKLVASYKKPNSQVCWVHSYNTYMLLTSRLVDDSSQLCYSRLFVSVVIPENSLSGRKAG